MVNRGTQHSTDETKDECIHTGAAPVTYHDPHLSSSYQVHSRLGTVKEQ